MHFTRSTFFSTITQQSRSVHQQQQAIHKLPEPNDVLKCKDHWEHSENPVQSFEVFAEQVKVRVGQRAWEVNHPPLAMHTITPRLMSDNACSGIQIIEHGSVVQKKSKHTPVVPLLDHNATVTSLQACEGSCFAPTCVPILCHRKTVM